MKTMPQQTAGLAKRLAEAADGFRDGKYYYFVSKAAYDFDLQYARGTTDEQAYNLAQNIKDDKGADYQIYGPYKTDSSEDPPLMDFNSVEMHFIKQGLSPVITAIEPDVDAIVLSLAAYDKFFHSYFLRLYGSVVANLFRSAAITALSSSPLVPVRHGNATALRTT
jgi:hypothetical protein